MTVRVKGILANAALAVGATVSAFAIGEIVARWLYADQTPIFPRFHTDYQYGRYMIRGIRPKSTFRHTSVDGSWTFVTNSRGFRNTQEFAYGRQADTLRVLSLGDSHTQGYEVRQEFTFSAVLERYLRRGGKAEVINAGVSGFSTAEELVFLENEGIKYRPDVVVLGFFGNDFEDNLKAGLFDLDQRNRLTELKYEHLPGVRIQNFIYSIPTVQWFSENSYFYSLLFNSVWNYFKARLGELAARQSAAKGRPSPATIETAEHAVPLATTQSEYVVGLAAALLERMHRFCTERGIRLLVVDVPTRAGPYRHASSLVPALRERLQAARIEYIGSESLLINFEGVAEMHVPRGHQHISELTHTLIGIEIGRRILSSAPGIQRR